MHKIFITEKRILQFDCQIDFRLDFESIENTISKAYSIFLNLIADANLAR